jgi:arylsulfatase A-like enzyme
VDDCLGKLFAGMRQMGYFDDSVIVLLSDHGHPLADHGKFLKGPDRMYSELLKVPFIVRLPGGQYGPRRATGLGRFADLLPTMLDLADLRGYEGSMAGKSLRPLIHGTSTSPHSATISGYFSGIDRCIRNERYSYVFRPSGQKDELYDVQADPREENNLIDEKPEVAQHLLEEFGATYFSAETRFQGVQGSSEVADTPLA